MRQLPQDSWGSRYLSKLVSILSMMSLQAVLIKKTQHLWTRLATSFVVMASTSLLLLLTLSRVLKSQVLYCGRVVSLFLSVPTGSQRLASLLASRHLFYAISVRSVILVQAWSCDGDFSLINHVGDHSTKG